MSGSVAALEEEVSFVEITGGQTLRVTAAAAGVELIVLDGVLGVEGREMSQWDWLRLPDDGADLRAERATSTWLKTGHLRQEPSRV